MLKHPTNHKFYVGYTSSLKRRLLEHFQNKSTFTMGKTWYLYMYFSFSNKTLSEKFEAYLKTGSGRAFSKKRFEFQFDEALPAQAGLA